MTTYAQGAIFSAEVEDKSDKALAQFRRVTAAYLLFHLSMAVLVVAEWALLISLMVLMPRSGYLAITLAGLFLTLFSYIVLTYYYQAKKPEQLLAIRDAYLESCRETFDARDPHTYHLGIARAAYNLFQLISSNPEGWHFLPDTPSLRHINRLLHWKDRHVMQEMLMHVTITHHIELIKQSPTNIEAHTSLANAYIALAKLYSTQKWFWTFTTQKREEMTARHTRALGQAIEELKILDSYTPNDPWVHATLATCYHHLGESDKEIEAYETLARLRPDDHDVTYRLGLLYFSSGASASALKIYERLRRFDPRKALELISHYDTYVHSHLSPWGTPDTKND